MKIQQYNKAIAGALTPAIILIISRFAAQYNVVIDAELQNSLLVLITAAMVYYVPNIAPKKKTEQQNNNVNS